MNRIRGKKRNKQRTVFINNKVLNEATIVRQSFIAVIMLVAGSTILYQLHYLPGKSKWTSNIINAWDSLLNSIYSISQSLFTFLFSLTIFFLIILGIILITGGLIRSFRLFSYFSYKNNKRKRRSL